MRQFLLSRATKRFGLEWIPIDVSKVNYSNLPEPSDCDLVFGFTINSNYVERLLLRPWVRTFYASYEAGILLPDPQNWTAIHSAYSVPMPKTVLGLAKTKAGLDATVEALGGFPFVVKTMGFSQGKGVSLITDFESLRRMAEGQDSNRLTIARELIPTQYSTRSIVIGDEVFYAYDYHCPAGDFRSNARSVPRVSPRDADDELRHASRMAVHTLGLRCGGVDLVKDEKGRWLVLEVNFPFNFVTPQLILKSHVSDALIHYLANSTPKLAKGEDLNHPHHTQTQNQQ